MWDHKNWTRRQNRRKQAGRKVSPLIEAFEDRVLLSSATGFLQGTVVLANTGKSVDNGDTFDPSVGKTPQPLVGGVGATVALFQGTTTTGIPYATTITDANGNYSFSSLPVGTYTLVESPPTGYANDGTEVSSPLNPATGGTNTITVTVEDLSKLSVTYNAPYEFQNLYPGVLELEASPNNGASYENEDFSIGQMPVTVTYPGGTTSQFASFCVNVFSSLDYGVDTYSASGQPLGTALVPPTNAGAIAYLYQQYNSFLYQQFDQPISNPASAPTNPLTGPQALDAQALQLAIWKLIYDTGSNLQSFSSGNIINPSYNSAYNSYPGVYQNPPSITDLESQALSYINDALKNSPGQTIELDATSGTSGYQSQLAPGSLNFSNIPQPSISTSQTPPSATVGSSIADTATVSGGDNPTGTVTFNLYNNSTDTGTPLFTDANVPLSSGTAASTGYVATATGTDYWVATYNGDSNNAAVSSGTASEPVTVSPASSSVSTTILDSGGGPVTGELGEQVYDTATVTGTPGFTPTGTVVYDFYTTSSPVYGTTPPSSTETVTLTDTGAVPKSSVTAPLRVGNYSYIAIYSGDSNYAGSVGAVEPLNTVQPNLPTEISGFDYLVPNTTASGSLTTATTGNPISGTTVILTGTDVFGDVVSETTTTAADGSYSFTGLNPSNASGYTVTETPPASDSHLGQTSTTTGAVTTPAPTPVVSNIVLSPGQTSTDNFFETASVSITGTDYLVSNTTPASSLTTSTTGIGIPGTTVLLSGTDEFGNPVSVTATTSASGRYGFTGLNPSNSSGYTVIETPPTSYTHLGQTSTTAGAVTTPAPTPVVSSIVLDTGGDSSTDNFFETASVSITGTDYLVSNTTPASSLTTSTTGIGIPGTTVLLSGTDEFGNPVSVTATTNGSGQYSFTGLNPSNGSGYTVTETPPASDSHLGQTSTTTGAVTTPAPTPVVSSIVLDTGGDSSTDNFFETASVSITGTDYLVSNTTPASSLTTSTTGIGIPGTTVLLSGTDEFGNPVSVTATTNGSGQYSFTGLNPSNGSGYTVTETPPASDSHLGQTSTTTGAVTTPAPTPVVSSIVLTTANSPSTDNFFEIASVSITGTDYLVSNTTPASSLTTSTTGIGIPGTTVLLSGTDEFGNPVSVTATTSASGQYSFTGLNPSNGSGYTVTETPPASDSHLGQTSTTTGAVTTPAPTPVVSSIVLDTGGDSSTDNFFETASVSITGTDYLVSNTTPASSLTTSTTGIGIPGTTVLLSGTDEFGNPVSVTATTSASGRYGFTGLNPSNSSGYTVIETPPTSYTHLGQTSTTAGAVTTPAPTPVVSNIVLNPDNRSSTDNFFEIAVDSISGTVFCNCNNDGILQPGEPGIPGVTITLTGDDFAGTPVHLVTTTNSQGAYDFSRLNPGTYIVTESAPAGYFQGKNTAGTAGGAVSGDVISGITLMAGVDATGYNFANLAPSIISGEVYYDFNGNGVLDSDDFGIAHVTVTLVGTNDVGQSIDMSTVTNNEGVFSFGNLRPGTYDLIRIQPAIFRGTKNAAGSLGGTVNNNSISDIAVPGCATGVDYLFGELQRPTCSLHGLAITVGNLFYHFERTYQSDPAAFAQLYPNLTPSIAAGQVPWGKAPFPIAPLATYWVPTLGTKPIKIYPVKGVKYNPLISSSSGQSAVIKVSRARASSLKPVSVHTSSAVKPTLLLRILRTSGRLLAKLRRG